MDKNQERELIGQTLIPYTEKMQSLLAENLLKPPEEAAEAMANVQDIIKLIHSLGWGVNWTAKLNPNDPDKLVVEVNLWAPRENLSPENQAVYDIWREEVKKRDEGDGR